MTVEEIKLPYIGSARCPARATKLSSSHLLSVDLPLHRASGIEGIQPHLLCRAKSIYVRRHRAARLGVFFAPRTLVEGCLLGQTTNAEHLHIDLPLAGFSSLATHASAPFIDDDRLRIESGWSSESRLRSRGIRTNEASSVVRHRGVFFSPSSRSQSAVFRSPMRQVGGVSTIVSFLDDAHIVVDDMGILRGLRDSMNAGVPFGSHP